MRELVRAHTDYRKDYDKIAEYFISRTNLLTEEKLFNFCKDHLYYLVESDQKQTLRSPTAILILNEIRGVDCKHYASFIGGILDAINRTDEMSFDWFYRFASYSLADRIPEHVFVVVEQQGAEIWIDPVLDSFNSRFPYPAFIKDIKHRDPQPTVSGHMRNRVRGIGALHRISGVGALQRISGPDYYQVARPLLRPDPSCDCLGRVRRTRIGALSTSQTGAVLLSIDGTVAAYLATLPVVGWVAEVGVAVVAVVALFLNIFGSKYTESTGVRWLTQYYERWVLGMNVNSDNQVSQADTANAQKWFTYVLGVPIYDQYRVHALWGTSPVDNSLLNQTRQQRAEAFMAFPEIKNNTTTTLAHAIAATYIADQMQVTDPPGGWKNLSVAPWLIAPPAGEVVVTNQDGSVQVVPIASGAGVIGWARQNPAIAAGLALIAGIGIFELSK